MSQQLLEKGEASPVRPLGMLSFVLVAGKSHRLIHTDSL